MYRKIFFLIAIIPFAAFLIPSCGGEGVQKDDKPVDVQDLTKNQPETKGPEVKEADIQITHPLNKDWVTSGKSIYEMKCQPCHKLSEEKLVGPGWKDVTKRRTPVWIMNMITNTEYMLDKDAEAQKLLELCMVRMPNQNLTLEEARQVLEFQRSNDGEK
jgi:cytochrome c5